MPASVSNTVGAASGLVDWNDGDDTVPIDGAALNDGLWRFRSTQGGDNGTWEATGSSAEAEDAVEIKTSVTGLTNDTYDVYVFYRSDDGTNNWKIRAGLSSNPNSNTLYDRTGVDGTAGIPALSGSSQLTFTGTAPTEDTGQPLLYAQIGQVTGTAIDVFIDDFPASTTGRSQDRTWYDGIGYELFVPPTIIESVTSGLASNSSTWSDSNPPSATNNYHVVNTHTVTVGADFPGLTLEALSGGTVSVSQSAVHFPSLIIRSGGSLDHSVSGNFALGDFNAAVPGSLTLEEDVTLGIDAGSDLFLDLELFGAGDFNFSSNGAGSDLLLSAAGSHAGTIRFNGSGDEVRVDQAEAFNILEMNSTGANRLLYDPTALLQTGTLIFNQPGAIDHATTQTAGPQVRLIGPAELEVNASVTVDLTKTFPINERRLFISSELRGAGNIIVNGTSTDPTSGSITHNEFELGSSGQPSGPATVDPYSGTISTNGFVDIEMRHNLPNAKFVINSNGRLEMGWQNVSPNQSISLGEVQVNSGGTLEVGYEQDGNHNAHALRLTSGGGQSGSLTLATGASTRMQVNGTASDEFDSIVAEGNVTLAGALEILVNPDGSGGTNPTYAPTLGDTFDIISISASLLSTDFDGNGSVDGLDLAEWETGYGVGNGADADGDGDSDGSDFLAWQLDFGSTGSLGGTISGTFDSLTITDPGNVMSGAGLTFQINYVSPTLVQLEVISASPLSAVPEPASGTMAASAAIVLLANRRRWIVRK